MFRLSDNTISIFVNSQARLKGMLNDAWHYTVCKWRICEQRDAHVFQMQSKLH